jgi:transposase InsO family protein
MLRHLLSALESVHDTFSLPKRQFLSFHTSPLCNELVRLLPKTELLNESLFLGLNHARTQITNWVDDYNQRRPHSALGYLTPAAYAANLSTTRDRLRNPNPLRRSHVAPPAPHGVNNAGALIAIG